MMPSVRSKSRFTTDELEAIGVPVVRYSGPRIRLSAGALLASLVLIAGTAGIVARAEARGRNPSLWVPATIYVAFALFIGTVIALQIRRLRSTGRQDLLLLGWSIGSMKRIGPLAGHGSAGWRSPIGSPVVGMYVTERGGLWVLVDQRGIGLVAVDQRRLRASIAQRDRRFWILLADGANEVALRLWRPRIR